MTGGKVRRTDFTVDDFILRSAASPASLETYARQMKQLEGWMGKALGKASKRDLTELKAKLRKMDSGPQYARLLRMFYKKSGQRELFDLCALKQRLKKISPDDILTLPEIQRMIDADASLRDKAMLATLWETGVRIHELMAVRLSDVRVLDGPENGGHKVFRIWFGKVKVSGEEHSGFVIESAPVMAAWLKAHPSKRPDAPLFPSWNGGPLSRHGGNRIVKEAARKASVTKRVYPHLFRHSRATHLLRLGVREGQVKKLMGWKPGSLMLSRYSHLVDTDAYRELLERQGYEVPRSLDLGKLTFEEDALKAVVPMNAPPAAPTIRDEIDKLPPTQLRQLVQILDHLAAAKGA